MSDPSVENAVAQTWMAALRDTESQLNGAPAAAVPPSAPTQPVRPAQPPLPPSLQRFGYGGMMARPQQDVDFSSPSSKPNAWYKNTVFQQVAAIAGVFLLSFILLIAIRPPFTFNKPKSKLETGKFSSGKAALFALIATIIAGIIMGVIAAVQAKKK